MAQQPTAMRLFGGGVPSSPTAVITQDSSTRAIISSVRLVNGDDSDHDVSMWIVPNGGSVDSTSNLFMAPTTVKAGKTYHETQISVVLEPGDQVYMGTDAAGVSAFVSGASLAAV